MLLSSVPLFNVLSNFPSPLFSVCTLEMFSIVRGYVKKEQLTVMTFYLSGTLCITLLSESICNIFQFLTIFSMFENLINVYYIMSETVNVNYLHSVFKIYYIFFFYDLSPSHTVLAAFLFSFFFSVNITPIENYKWGNHLSFLDAVSKNRIHCRIAVVKKKSEQEWK